MRLSKKLNETSDAIIHLRDIDIKWLLEKNAWEIGQLFFLLPLHAPNIQMKQELVQFKPIRLKRLVFHSNSFLIYGYFQVFKQYLNLHLTHK